MRIVIDMSGAQSIACHNRGIDRYSRAIVKAIIRQKDPHEIFLVLSHMLPDTFDEIYMEFAELLPKENIKTWCSPRKTFFQDPANSWRRRVAEQSREAFLYSLNPDLIFITSLFEGLTDDSITTVGLYNRDIPVAIVLYDLIPLLNPARYLDNNLQYKQWYMEKIEYLKRADMLLSISESSKNEALDHLGFSLKKVLNIGTASSDRFERKDISAEQKKEILDTYQIKRPFLMQVGANDSRKNQEGLIRAYAKLDPNIRKTHQLVFVFEVSQGYKKSLETLAKNEGLEKDDIVITNFVSEKDLIALYNLCKAFILPSLHEGFGLPALEAMQCGAPTIVGDNSSLPEVVDMKEALFNARDDQDMANKITEVLTDEVFRNRLIVHAKFQITKFSWDISAKKTIEAFENLANINPNNEQKLKLAYVSPLFSIESNASLEEYNKELLSQLSHYYDIEIIAEQKDISDPWIKEHCVVHDVTWFKENSTSYNRILYHIGNTHFHRYAYRLVQEYPGTIILQDFFLSDMISQMNKDGYQGVSATEELYYSHGYKALQDSTGLTSKYPMNRRVLDHAKGIIVHSENFEKLAGQWYGRESAINWTFIPNPKTHILQETGRQFADTIEAYYSYEKNEKDCLIEQLRADNIQTRDEAARAIVQAIQDGKKAITQAKEEGIKTVAKVRQSENLVKKQYSTILHSNSWKLTAPLRFLGRKLRWFFGGAKDRFL